MFAAFFWPSGNIPGLHRSGLSICLMVHALVHCQQKLMTKFLWHSMLGESPPRLCCCPLEAGASGSSESQARPVGSDGSIAAASPRCAGLPRRLFITPCPCQRIPKHHGKTLAIQDVGYKSLGCTSVTMGEL